MGNDYEIAASLIEAECRDKLASAKTAEEALAITFAAAKNHWMFTDEQTQFKGALGAAMIALKEGPEFDRIIRSTKHLSKASAMLSALQQGIPVDIVQVAQQQEKENQGFEIIPLNKMWHEAHA